MSRHPRFEPSRARSLLVRAPNWVGDAILAVPALEALREGFPQARIVVLAVPWVADVFRFVPAVDQIELLDRKGRHRGVRGIERWRRDRGSAPPDVAISLPRSLSSAWTLLRSGAPIRAGFDGPGRGLLLTERIPFPGKGRPGRHELELHLDLVRGIGLAAPGRLPRLVVPVQMAVRRDEILSASGLRGVDYVAISPGAAFGGAKRWSAKGFAEVLDRLHESRGLEAVLLGSPGERPIALEVVSLARRPPVDLVGRVSLAESLSILAGAKLLLSNDSGLMHAGAALEVPVVAIFGPTDSVATGPLGPRSTVVREPVSCAPCFLRDCPIDHRCMERVSSEAVLASSAALLDGRRTLSTSSPSSGHLRFAP